MKNEFKISSIAVACVLCLTASAAYSASSVRALGGTGTYTSASAASGGSSGSVATPSVARSGSVRVNSTVNKGSSATTGTNTSRVVTMPRLSIGNYLGGGTSISGGSSLRPMQPGGGSSSSSGGSGNVGQDIIDQVDALGRRVDGLETKYDEVSDSLFDKQDTLNPVDEYIVVEGADIYLDIEKLKQDIETGTGNTGNVEFRDDGVGLQYRIGAEDAWKYVITYAELAEKGGYALKSELEGKADKSELDSYSTTTEMNLAIAEAIEAAKVDFATKEDLASKANVTDVYTKTEVDQKLEGVVVGDLDETLKSYAKTQYVDEGLAKKADKTEVADMLTKTEAASTYATQSTVSGYAAAIAGAVEKAETAQTGVDALKSTVGTGELQTSSKQVIGAINELKVKTDGMATDGNFEEMNQKITEMEGKVDEAVGTIAGKADTTYVDGQLELKADKTELGAYAKKGEIKDADIAADAAISKTKLAQDVQESLNKADSAVSMQGAENSSVLGTDENGDTVWYKVAI